jgi:hypothetical protein
MLHSVTSDRNKFVVLNGEQVRIWRLGVVAYFYVVFLHSLVESDDKHERPQSGQPGNQAGVRIGYTPNKT